MAYALTEWALRVLPGEIRPLDRLALAYLAMRSNGTNGGAAFPSLTTISRDLGIARSTVCESLSRLEESGLLTVSRSPQKANRYLVRQPDHLVAVADQVVREADQGSPPGGPEPRNVTKEENQYPPSSPQGGAKRRRAKAGQAEEWIRWWNERAPERFSRSRVFPRAEARRLEQRLAERGYTPEQFRADAPGLLDLAYPGAEDWLTLPWLARPKSDLTRLLEGGYSKRQVNGTVPPIASVEDRRAELEGRRRAILAKPGSTSEADESELRSIRYQLERIR